MDFRIDEQPQKLDRFDDTRTTYNGRRQKLPVFWLENERFSLKLSSMVRAAEDAREAQAILESCASQVGADAKGLEGAAVLLQEYCRRLIGWKAKVVRDKPRRTRRHAL